MNKNNLVKIIGRELSILTDFVNGFNDGENIHPMEVDLALSKTKDIYNELLMLKGEGHYTDLVISNLAKASNVSVELKEPIINTVAQIADKMTVETEINMQIEKEFIAVEELVLEAMHQLPIFEGVQEEEVKPEELIELLEDELLIVDSEKSETEIISPVIDEEKAAELIVEPTTELKLPIGIVEIRPNKVVAQTAVSNDEHGKNDTLANKFLKEALSVNDRLSSLKNNNDLASLLKGTAVTDLKKAIKLNDRVWFTNELFNKNSATFEKAIDVVNTSADLDSALKYLVENYTWNQESQSTISFLELVCRRFPSK